MPDVLDELFDLDTPATALTPERLRTANSGTARRRVLELLRERPLTGERVLALAALLDHLGVRRLREPLGQLCGDPNVPALNRAAPALLLLRDDLDPGLPPDRLPVLAEGLLLGCAMGGRLRQLGPTLAVLCASPAFDVDALVARIEPWRLPAIAPGDLVYGDVLRSRACARAHARVLEVVERDPAVDAVVRAAAASRALDGALAERFLARAAPAPLEPRGAAWVGPRCGGCGGRVVQGVVHLPDDLAASFQLHLTAERAEDAEVTPLCSAAFTRLLAAESEAWPGHVEIPLGSVAATAVGAIGADETASRALWLLRRLRPDSVGLDEALVRTVSARVEVARALAGSIGQDATEDDVHEATHLLLEALEAGVFSPPEAEDDAHAGWRALLSSVVDALARQPIRWDAPVWNLLTWAGSSVGDALDEAERRRGLLPWVRREVPVERVDPLAWREVLARAAAAGGRPEHRRAEIADAIRRNADALRRLGRTTRDLARDLGAPTEVVGPLAAALGLRPDEPLARLAIHDEP